MKVNFKRINWMLIWRICSGTNTPFLFSTIFFFCFLNFIGINWCLCVFTSPETILFTLNVQCSLFTPRLKRIKTKFYYRFFHWIFVLILRRKFQKRLQWRPQIRPIIVSYQIFNSFIASMPNKEHLKRQKRGKKATQINCTHMINVNGFCFFFCDKIKSFS